MNIGEFFGALFKGDWDWINEDIGRRNGITDMQIQLCQDYVQSGLIPVSYGILMNAGAVANIVRDNLGLLDPVTAAYLQGFSKPAGEMAGILGRAQVYLGVDPARVAAASGKLGIPFSGGADAMGIGGNVYWFDSVLLTVGSGPNASRVFDSNDAQLLAHEGIHLIQAAAYGGHGAFTTAYRNSFSDRARLLQMSDGPEKQSLMAENYRRNTFEQAAYNFGPRYSLFRPRYELNPSAPILKNLYGGSTWWY